MLDDTLEDSELIPTLMPTNSEVIDDSQSQLQEGESPNPTASQEESSPPEIE